MSGLCPDEVLAGQELERDWGYKFVTWRRSPDRTAVGSGDYFDGGHFYGAAKLDFACRAGLVDEHRQFTDEQLTELYHCVCETLESGYPLTREREKLLTAVMEQIKHMGPPLRPSEAVSVGRGSGRSFRRRRKRSAADFVPTRMSGSACLISGSWRRLNSRRAVGRIWR